MSSITVIQGKKHAILYAKNDEKLFELLRGAGFELSAPCGGAGKCGKCRVRLVRDGREEIVLACRTRAEGDCTVILPERAGDGLIESGGFSAEMIISAREGFGAAVDIGTTTVVVKLFDLSDGRELGSSAAWNAQAPYGADVISRCQFTMERPRGLEILSGLVRKQVQGLVEELCGRLGLDSGAVKEIFVAGNTVMQHIFAGVSPAGIALAPFRPATLFDRTWPADTLGGMGLRYAPCVAGYVGGDISAGLLASGIAEKHRRALFLDVGTNGEMAIGGRDGFVSCAVACGPAFEGAGISCGMPSTPGAVSHVDWRDGELVLEVIGGGEAKGICGSGLIDLMALLLEKGVIDEGGRLLPPDEAPEGFERWLDEDENGNGLFFLGDEEDAVCVTAGDVRQLQLAKAAVAAGITVLLHETGADFESIEALYLAGGFGSHMRAESAVILGMLPAALADRVRPLGNASLEGARQALLSRERLEEMYNIAEKCAYHELSGSPAFNAAYPTHMSFDKEETQWSLNSL